MATEITDINQLDLTKSYTYADYLNWRFHEGVELIMGRFLKCLRHRPANISML